MKKIFSLLSFFLVGAFSVEAQTYCLGYDVVSVIGTDAVIQLKLQGSTSFKLGSSNLRFNYNNTSMTNPVLETIAPGNSALTTPTPYSTINITLPTSSGALETTRLNALLSGAGLGATIDAAPGWTNLGRVKFTTVGASPTTALSFNPSSSLVYKDDNLTKIFSGSGCPNLDVPLPVEIVSFNATKSNTNTLLTWKTVNALQMNHFDVERSKDGLTFTAIGQAVKAVNTIDKMAYNLTDEKPLEGINYYRLKSVEASGKVAYSKVLSVVFGSNFVTKAFPNPFHDVLTLDVKNDKTGTDMTFELIDVLGKQVAVQKRKVSGSASVTFNTLELTAGSYIIRVKDADNVWQEKFVKY